MSAIFGNKPDRWELLQVGTHRWKHDVQDFDGPPGRRLEAFTLWLQGPGVLADCFQSHVTAEDDGWHYTMRGVDLAEGGYTMDLLRAGVIVRDVPPPLLVNCEVTVTENKYKALFTTLAGSELATMQEDLPDGGPPPEACEDTCLGYWSPEKQKSRSLASYQWLYLSPIGAHRSMEQVQR